MQMEKVVRLKHLIAELGVTDPLLSLVEASAHRLLLHHHVHREVLPDIPEKLDEADPRKPFEIIDDLRPIPTRAREVEHPLKDRALRFNVGLNLLGAQKGALGALAGRIADHPGSPAHHDDRVMARPLKVRQEHDRHQITDGETICRWIKSNVGVSGLLGKMGRQFFRRGLMKQTTPCEFIEKVAQGGLVGRRKESRLTRGKNAGRSLRYRRKPRLDLNRRF